MGKINQLSFEVANLIAAGEVVDRPASAIKELMENSIDAGARHVTVEIKNGGITFMRVSDDGCGMEPEDLPMAVRRHATSKISTASDLDGICTLGFRGEALAAIASVSKLRIISKPADAVLGAALDVDRGKVEGLTERGCSDGTTIIAEELFANVPARRKFLKRDITETTAVCANVEKIALSHPEIAFRLITDGQVKLETAGDGQLKNTIYSVFGKDFASKLIEVDGDFEGISVKGYVGRSDNVKGNRNYQNFYINKRFVKSKTVSAALEQAYISYLPAERFPVCVLFICLNPERVDVNVHPAKLEVKFSNEKIVFEAVYYSVKQALEQNTERPQIEVGKNRHIGDMKLSGAFAPVEKPSVKPEQMSIGTEVNIAGKSHAASGPKGDETFERITAREYVEKYVGLKSEKKPETGGVKSEKNSDDFQGTPNFSQKKLPDENEKTTFPEPPRSDNHNSYKNIEKDFIDVATNIPYAGHNDGETDTDDIPAAVFLNSDKHSEMTKSGEQGEGPVNKNQEQIVGQAEPEEETSRENTEYRLIGEAFNSYLIVELKDKLLIIDKHAAHERIIFERLKSNMYNSQSYSQLLMIPTEVMLMTDEVSALEEYREELEKVGFGFTTARNTVSVNEIPAGIEQAAVADMLAVIADRIKNGTGNVNITRNIIFEKALYQASCKAAIKAGIEYPEEDGKWIVQKLMEIPDITFCPHGRPVAMEMSKKNMDRQFERT